MVLLHREPSELLTAILFGNLIVNILFFCIGASAAAHWETMYGEWAEALIGLIILLLLILCGEIVPKAIGINHPVGVLRITAVPLRIWFYFIQPFRRLIRLLLQVFRLQGKSMSPRIYLTAGELKELIDAVRHEPGFGSQEKEILEDIVNLSDMRAREIMVPRVQVLRKPLTASREELLQEARQHEYSRILIYRDRDDDPLGYIRVKDLFMDAGRTPALEPFLQPLVFVPETKRADQLLREFLANDWKLVAVVDEYGGLAGIITMEDLLAEVVSDLAPDPEEEIQQLDETTYRLHGQLSIRAWRELFIGFLPEPEVEGLAFDTLGGLIISLLGRMPRIGDTVSVRNLFLKVETIHHRHIETVLLYLQAPKENA
jgi:CBS domain containing-hemolysin-like protein